MDFMEKITELRAKKGQLLTQAQALVDEGKIEEANEFTSQMEAINTSIAGLEALAKASQEGAEPVYDGALHGGKPKDEGKGEDKPFTSLGEQLQAVYNFRKNHVEDKRLQRVNNAVLGVNEGSGADGGFVIQTDFAGMILESARAAEPPAQPAGPLHLLQRGQRHAVDLGRRDRREQECVRRHSDVLGRPRGPRWRTASPGSGK